MNKLVTKRTRSSNLLALLGPCLTVVTLWLFHFLIGLSGNNHPYFVA